MPVSPGLWSGRKDLNLRPPAPEGLQKVSITTFYRVIAGSFPIWLRSDPSDYGDYEQTIPEFYEIANYLELYFLNSYGDRTLFLFYNEFDPCCFSGEVYNQTPFADSIKTKLSKFGKSNFDVIIDYGQTEHIISDYTLKNINESLMIKKT